MKNFALLNLIVLLFAVSVFAQVSNTPPPLPKVIELEGTNPLDNFSKRGLPQPYFLGRNRSEELAVWIAKELAKYDEEALPILISALQKSGFYIIDQNQKILYSPSTTYDMEMSFYDFEVAGMLKMSAFGKTTTIKKLAEVLSQNIPQVSADGLGKSILNDLRKARKSEDMRLKFAASLIFEMGRQMSTPVDLNISTPENSKINIIQLALIQRMLLGDLIDSYSKLVAADVNKRKLFQSNEVRFINAAFLKSANSLCDSWDDLSIFQNKTSNTYQLAEKNTIFAETLDECELLMDKKKIDECKAKRKKDLQQQFLEQIGKGLRTGIISSATDSLEAASQSIRIDLIVQAPAPLVRTKSASGAGETRDITAKLTMEPISPQTASQIGCMKKLTESSPNFNLYEPVSLDGAKVEWKIGEGGGLVKFSTQSDKLTGQTGESKISLVGKPQREDLTNRKTYATPETAEVVVTVSGNRASFASKTVRVPVRDWIPCSDDWGGKITYLESYSYTTSNGSSSKTTYDFRNEMNIRLNPRKPEEMAKATPNANIHVDYSYDVMFEGERDVSICCPDAGNQKEKVKKRTSYFQKKNYKSPFFVLYTGGERDFTLGFISGLTSIRARQTDSSETIRTTCSLDEDLDDLAPLAPRKSPYANPYNDDYLEPLAPKKTDDDELAPLGKYVNVQLPVDLENGRYGQRFTGTAGEFLFGSKKFPRKNGGEATWTWELSRCKD
jgi:hypothetical protein